MDSYDLSKLHLSLEKLAPSLSVTDWGICSDVGDSYPTSNSQSQLRQHWTWFTLHCCQAAVNIQRRRARLPSQRPSHLEILVTGNLTCIFCFGFYFRYVRNVNRHIVQKYYNDIIKSLMELNKGLKMGVWIKAWIWNGHLIEVKHPWLNS